MRFWLLKLSRVSCVICILLYGRFCEAQEFEIKRSSSFDYTVEERSFLFGKLVLVPVLAAIGLKFLALLPIVLMKIALLSAMNFLSTNLNLLVSTLFGLKNFMNKFGLWGHDDNTRHPELDAFAEIANQPIPILQPSYRYHYVMDSKVSKMPSLMKEFSGFVPTDSGLYQAKLDRRTKATDKRHIQKQKSVASAFDGTRGKYKCYWSTEQSNERVDSEKQGEYVDKDKLHAPKMDLHSYSLEPEVYSGLSHEINEPLQKYVSPSNLPDYRSHVKEVPSQQVATQASAEKIDDEVGMRDGLLLLPFTRSSVK